MATVILNFSEINSPVLVGDTVYYLDNLSTSLDQDAFTFGTDTNNIVKIGDVVKVNGNNIVVNVTLNVNLPSANDFVFVAKDNQVQLSSMIGYYAEVKMVNNSNEKSELYAVAIDADESSK